MTAMNSDALDGTSNESALLERAGLAAGDASAWLAAVPELRKDFRSDSAACSTFWALGQSASRATAGQIGAQPRRGRGERRHPSQRAGPARAFPGSPCRGALRQAHRAAGASSSASSELVPDAAKLLPGLDARRAKPWRRRTRCRSRTRKASRSTTAFCSSHVLAHPGDSAGICATPCCCRGRKRSICCRGFRGDEIDRSRRRVREPGGQGVDRRVAKPGGRSTRSMRRRWHRSRPRSISPSSIAARRSRCCAAAVSTIRNMPAGGYVPPASISPISIRARSPSCSTSSM